MPLLRYSAVTLHAAGFDEDLVQQVSLEVQPGASVALIGPPGCGKSSLLGLALGGESPHGGTVEVLGRDPTRLRDAALMQHRTEIGLLPQRGGLLSNLSLVDNILLPLRYHRQIDEDAARARLRELQLLAGVDEPPRTQAALASPSWRWVATLMRALVLQPRLLLVDDLGEELNAADREDLWRLLWRVVSDSGVAVLAATADASAAAILTSEVVHLRHLRPAGFRLLDSSVHRALGTP
jgi:ABC-type lipoprotein export system ATPase subunit